MFRLHLLFLFLTLALSLSAQFQIGHTSITFTDPSRNNRSIPTEIYYPAVLWTNANKRVLRI